MGLLRVMEESWVFLGSSGGSIRVIIILPKLGHLFPSMEVLPQLGDFFVDFWRNVRVRGLFGPSGVMEESWVFLGSSGGSIRVIIILPKLGHLFASMEILPQLGDFFVADGEM